MKYAYILLLLAAIAGGCHRKPVKIIVDLTNRGWSMIEGDSILWQAPIWRRERITDSTFQVKEYPTDTFIGLLHFKPTVVIYDGKDTQRSFFDGDTLRFESCTPIHDTVYLSTKIGEARDVYIGPHK